LPEGVGGHAEPDRVTHLESQTLGEAALQGYLRGSWSGLLEQGGHQKKCGCHGRKNSSLSRNSAWFYGLRRLKGCSKLR
jgi:hypothetical protein